MRAPRVSASREEYVLRRTDAAFWRPTSRRSSGVTGWPTSRPSPGTTRPTPTFPCGDVAVKLFGGSGGWRARFDAERAAHALVATDPGIAAPAVVAEGCLGGDDEWPYLVTTRMAGVAWRDAGLSAAQRRAVAADLGEQVRRIHALDPSGAVAPKDWPAPTWPRRPRGARCRPTWSRWSTGSSPGSGPPDRPVFVHGDLVANHLFVEGGRLAGIIDWGDALATDRHHELIQPHRDMFDCDPKLLHVFLEASAWPVGEDFASRALGHALRRQAVGLAQHHGDGRLRAGRGALSAGGFRHPRRPRDRALRRCAETRNSIASDRIRGKRIRAPARPGPEGPWDTRRIGMSRLTLTLFVTTLVAGCAASSVHSNRRLWQGFLNEAEPTTTADARDTFAAKVARSKDQEPLGLSIVANEVLGRAIPANTETVTNACLCALMNDDSPHARRGADTTDDQKNCRSYVFSNAADVGSERARRGDLKGDGFVPKRLRETDFMREYVGVLVDPEGAKKAESSRISRADVSEFGKEAYRLAADPEEAGKSTVGRMLSLYLSLYMKGEFVDRRGRKFAKPSIFNPIGGDKPIIQVSNDVIANIAAVALEAVTDVALGTPILVKADGTFYTKDKPTYAVLFGAVEPVRETPTEVGITELERGLMLYVSDLAGVKSRLLSSLVFGFLSEAELEFVLGAHIALGDNDTLKILLDTLFEVGARNLSEHFSYRGLSHFEYTVDETTGRVRPVAADDKQLGRVIALLLQEQELLRRLVPPENSESG